MAAFVGLGTGHGLAALQAAGEVAIGMAALRLAMAPGDRQGGASLGHGTRRSACPRRWLGTRGVALGSLTVVSERRAAINSVEQVDWVG